MLERPKNNYQKRININDAGPDEARERQVAALMNKLRQRGSVGDSSTMSDAEQLLKSPKKRQEQQEQQQQPPPPPQQQQDEQQEEEKAAEPKLATSGIGGSWSGKEAVAQQNVTMKPKVSTWGVFERPSDISKAYGGGRRVGVGGYQPSEEEIAKKKAEKEALLAAYRASRGADLTLQEAHLTEIEEALKESRQLTRLGSTRAALDALQAVKQWLCVASDFGSEALLELGLAVVADAQADDSDANVIFKEIVQRSPNKQTRRAAQQMLFQETAAEFLKLRDDETEATSEFAKLSGIRTVGGKRYAITGLSGADRPPVSTPSEARMVLRSAAVSRTDKGAPQRIVQAIDLLRKLPAADRVAETPAAAGSSDAAATADPAEATAAASRARELVAGEWLLGLTVTGERIKFAPPEAIQTLRPAPAGESGAGGAAAEGTFDRLAPAGLGLVRTRGRLTNVAGTTPGEVCLRFDVSQATLGPLPLPLGGKSTEERALLLDSTLCVLQQAGGDGVCSVWARPLQ